MNQKRNYKRKSPMMAQMVYPKRIPLWSPITQMIIRVHRRAISDFILKYPLDT
jgi:hypothetical protein